MNKNISKLIEDLVTECECDNRIETGIFDIYNAEHLVVLSEHMAGHGISESVVESTIESMIGEGKYPERQAYNKDGWLVTFPSKEYRDAAIKKRSHFTSDPTHGKGGMNLYYKKKGKQKRQTAQTQTTTASQQPVQQAQPSPQTSQPENQPAATTTPKDQTTDQKYKDPSRISLKKDNAAVIDYIMSREKKSKQAVSAQPPAPSADSDAQPSQQPADQPAVDVPVVDTPAPKYSEISKQFAQKKGWMAEPYGEYRDREGNTVAVVGLSGEVVPTKSVDRDEYKLFAEKSMI